MQEIIPTPKVFGAFLLGVLIYLVFKSPQTALCFYLGTGCFAYAWLLSLGKDRENWFRFSKLWIVPLWGIAIWWPKLRKAICGH